MVAVISPAGRGSGGNLLAGRVFASLRRRSYGTHVPVLMYHEVAEDNADIESWSVVRRSDLMRQLQFLARHYRIVSLDEAVSWISSPIDEDRPPAVLTFDDGNRGNIEVLLPVLEAMQLPATLFIATGHVESGVAYWFDRIINALQFDSPVDLDLRAAGLSSYRINDRRGARNWATLQGLMLDVKRLPAERCEEIADGVTALTRGYRRREKATVNPLSVSEVRELGSSRLLTIGAHSHCHRVLTLIPADEARDSVARSLDLLRAWTGQPVRHFAYPSGAYDSALLETVRELGFATACTTEHAVLSPGSSPFAIPRIGVGRYDHMLTFQANLLGGRGRLLRQALGARLRAGAN